MIDPMDVGNDLNEAYCDGFESGVQSARPKWIPVTERMPEDHAMVIGFTPRDGYMFVGFHVTSKHDGYDFSYWSLVTAMRSTQRMTKKVTHWMPLPEKPKGEEDERC